ncbi:MAG: alcohol dehydrogenase catalytic domain-containing protein [Novosphingobium sp.]|nr:alcohol dehydrogenase catalytic domain-containing protein [Novosphingobium sp.]
MKAAYVVDGAIRVGEVPEPTPGHGQALVRTHACGMCASDLHFLHSGQKVIDLSRQHGGAYAGLDMGRPFVPGHEYVGEVLDYGPGSRRAVKPGRKVTSIPIMRQQGAHAVVGFSHECPGGYGELMLLDEDMLLELPEGLPDAYAAMTEPLAVGLEHARRGRPTADDTALVVGCGAIGLGVIVGLKLMGIAPIVAADFSPERRAMALRMGADLALDPRETSPYGELAELGKRRVNLVYECAAFDARIVIGGYCMEPESLYVFAAQNKRLTVHFAGGEEPQDMALAARTIADGKIDIAGWVGAEIGLEGVAAAMAGLASREAPVRTVIDPRRL